MTDADDPLLVYLHRELELISDAVGLRASLGLPITPLADDDEAAQTYRWTFRFTWQEVERGRRYVLPLERGRARAAQQTVTAELAERAVAQAAADTRVTRNGPEIAAAAESAELEMRVLRSADGTALWFPDDPTVLALPLSAVRRRVRFNAALNVYAVSESIRVGALRLLRPELVRVIAEAGRGG